MEPVYDKHPVKPASEYRLMTWELFLTIREWAQEVANVEGYPIYLVGSALRKLYPRDIDVSIIMPLDEFEKVFGPIPDDKEELHKYLSHPSEVFTRKIPYWGTLNERIRWVMRADVKITPDTWHTNQDKMLLAEPNGKVYVRNWSLLSRANKEESL